MANINPNVILPKFFNLQNLTAEEWIAILTEWGKEVVWQPEEGDHPLIKWVNTRAPLPEVAEWITKHHGAKVWNQTDGKTTALRQLIGDVSSERTGNCVKALLPLVPQVDLLDALKGVTENNQRANEVVLGQPTTAWNGNLKAIAYFCRQGAPEIAQAYIDVYPDTLKERQWGYPPSAIMGVTHEGWDAYLKANGSLFDQVYNDPKTGQQTTVGLPLWSWLMQKKVYHEGMRKTLEQLLVRLQEGREPGEGDLVLTDFDWQQLVESKSLLLREMQMIEFEKKIQKDYKQALKENKHWRAWRSSEGANFMFWLACKKPVEFVRQAYKVRLNQNMIKSTDDLGRGFLPYLLTGALIEELGSWRKQEKFSNELWPEMLKATTDWMDLNPKRGLLMDWITSPNSSFFGAMGHGDRIKSGYQVSYIKEFFHKNPKVFWNGLNGEALTQVFGNPHVVKRATKLVALVVQGLPLSTWKEVTEKFSTNESLQWACLVAHSDIAGGLAGDVSADWGRMVQELQQDPDRITLSAGELDKMNTFVKNNMRSWNKSETLQNLEALLEKCILKAQIRDHDVAPVQAPRRKM